MKILPYLNRLERVAVNFVEGRYIFLVLSFISGITFPKSMCEILDGYTFTFCLKDKGDTEDNVPFYGCGIKGPEGFPRFTTTEVPLITIIIIHQ